MALAEGAASSAAERLAAFITVRALKGTAPSDKLWLTTADGSTTVSVPKQAHGLSGYLNRQLNALGLGESLIKPIVLPQQVGRETLSRLVTYFEFHCGATGTPSQEELKAFDHVFVTAGIKKLLELTSAAQSLEMPALMMRCLHALDEPGSTAGASCSSSPTSASAAAVRAAAKAPAAVGVISAAAAPLTHVISKATRSVVPGSASTSSASSTTPPSWPPVSQAQRTAIYHAAISAAASCGTIDYIWLATSDGSTVVSVHKKAAELSPFILRHLFSTSCGFTEADPILAPQQVGAATLKRLALYFNFHGAPGLSDKERKSFDERFVKLDTKRLCELMSAADSLEMRQLVELSSRALVKVIQGKTPEEIRDALNMPDDLTEEEKLEPVPGDPDDPRIRLLNRLYAKKRKELQTKKQEEPRPQQDRTQVQDTRTLDELLSFIGGEEDKPDPSKDKAAKKKKKKGQEKGQDKGQVQQDAGPSQAKEELDQQADAQMQQERHAAGADALSAQALKVSSTGKGTSCAVRASGGEVNSAGPGRPKGDAAAGAGESASSKGEAVVRQAGTTSGSGDADDSRGPDVVVSQPSSSGTSDKSREGGNGKAASGSAIATSAGMQSAGKQALVHPRAQAPAGTGGSQRGGQAGPAVSSSRAAGASATAQSPPVAAAQAVSTSALVETPTGSRGSMTTGVAAADVPAGGTNSKAGKAQSKAEQAKGPARSVPTAPANRAPSTSSTAVASSQAVAQAQQQQQQQQQRQFPGQAPLPTTTGGRLGSAAAAGSSAPVAVASSSAPVGGLQPLLGVQDAGKGASGSGTGAAPSAGPTAGPSTVPESHRRHGGQLSVAVDLGNSWPSMQSPPQQLLQGLAGPPGFSSPPLQAQQHLQQQQLPGWGQQDAWAAWAQQLTPQSQQQLPAQWDSWVSGSALPSPAQQPSPWSGHLPGLLPGDAWLQSSWSGQGADMPARPRARLSALPALEGDPDEA